MNERTATVTVLRCAGCEAHQRRIAELEAQIEELEFQLSSKVSECEGLIDRLLRAAAERENTRRRVIDAVDGKTR